MTASTRVHAAVLGALLLLGIPMGASAQSSSATQSDSIPSSPVVRGTFQRTVNSIGELKAARSSIIVSPFEGKVVRLVPEGSPVKEGEALLWMDTDELEENLKDHDASLLLAQKDLESAKEEFRLQEIQNDYNLKSEEARVELAEQRLKDAEQKYATEKELVDRNISARTKLEEAELTLTQAGVELRSARINLLKTRENLASNLRVKQTGIDKAQLEIERIERLIRDVKSRIDTAILRAPTDGEVAYFRIWKNGTNSKVAEGDQVWPRLNLMEIPDRSQMLAVVPVNELDVAEVREGQAAEIYLDAVPGRMFPGTVDRKSIVPIDTSAAGGRWGGGSSTNSGPKEFEVRITLADREPFFYQGMTATVRIVTVAIEGALMVPLESLTLENDKVGVFRSTTDGGQFVPLEVLQTNDRAAAVKGTITESDRVYLRHPKLPLEESRQRGFNALRQVEADLRKSRTEDSKSDRPGAEVSQSTEGARH
ncbi:HlyD family efflux transporter periplasmic adaptor subunit [bacterium]|nr:HlyD family efflux transporter periplasmic adaptor subunit [bacterium]